MVSQIARTKFDVETVVARVNGLRTSTSSKRSASERRETYVPGADTVLEEGNHVTFIGRDDAVRAAARRFHSHD